MRPVFARVLGKLCGQQIQSNVQGSVKQMLVQGHILRLQNEAGHGISSAHIQKIQDSQHKLNQPRGSLAIENRKRMAIFSAMFIKNDPHCGNSLR